MSRVLLVSMGVPAYVPARRHAGPGLRAAHFAHALSRAGADVLALCVCTPADAVVLGEAPAGGPDGVQTLFVNEAELAAISHAGALGAFSSGAMPDATSRGAAISSTAMLDATSRGDATSSARAPDAISRAAVKLGAAAARRPAQARASALRARIEDFAPQAVVGVTAYAAALALRLGLDLPLWADVFGDLLCEAQAKASVNGGDWSLVHFWTLLRPVLESADRFSAVSVAQSHALVGQLGLAGRLSGRTAGEELVAVIPCAAEAGAEIPSRAQARRHLGVPDEAFALLWSGGFNTWCDVDTAADGVGAALEDNTNLHLVVSGGTIPGHDEESFARFRQRLQASLRTASARERVHLLGWLPSPELPLLYAGCDLGLNIERPLYERRLGAENRVAEWQAHGLAALTTALSEAGTDLVRRELAWQTPVGDAAALRTRIGELAAAPALVAARGARAGEAAARELRFDVTAASLQRWCLAPRRAGDHGAERFVRMGLLSRPQASTELLEAYVKELPLSQLLRRGLRWTLRRAGAALSAGFRSNGRRW